MTHRLHADAVTLRRDARTVSRNLSLAIPEGSFSVIVGPNACGKSPLLAALSRLLAPAEGRVVLAGGTWRGVSAGCRRARWRRMAARWPSWWRAGAIRTSRSCASGRRRMSAR